VVERWVLSFKGGIKILAIIPARGGSKGVPGKNIKLLNGKPLIAYTIEAAKKSFFVNKIICSTDSEEIAEVAKTYGAEVLIRPVELARDDSKIINTYLHVMETVNKKSEFIFPYTHKQAEDYITNNTFETGNTVSGYCLKAPASKAEGVFTALLPTSPFRVAEDIDNAIVLFKAKKADSVISVTCAPQPISWYKRIDENGILREYFGDEKNLKNRQEEEQLYIPNGAIYIFRYDILKNQRVYYTDKTYPYIMPAERSIDIDTNNDFNYAEYLLRKD
jgi:N-acylneuraminate cytidylyltransferase/CMP-N,N'-diacetyllegionaminic acid synthase